MPNIVFTMHIPKALDASFKVVNDVFHSLNITPLRPLSNNVRGWNCDGEENVFGFEKLTEHIRQGEISGVLFWDNQSADYFVSWKRNEGICAFSISVPESRLSEIHMLANVFVAQLWRLFRNHYLDNDIAKYSMS
jgi:hypothetical protein